jgi:hypothetical protein
LLKSATSSVVANTNTNDTSSSFAPHANANHAALACAFGHFHHMYEVLYGVYCIEPQSPVIVQFLAHWLKSIGLLLEPFNGSAAVSLDIDVQIFRIHAILERLYANIGSKQQRVAPPAPSAPYPHCLQDKLYSETLEFIRSKFASIYVMCRFASVLTAVYSQQSLARDLQQFGAADPRMSPSNIVNASYKMQSLFQAYGMFSATVEAAATAQAPPPTSTAVPPPVTIHCDAISIIEMLNSVDESTFNEVIGVAQSIGPMVSSIASSMSSGKAGDPSSMDSASLVTSILPMLMQNGLGNSGANGHGASFGGHGGRNADDPGLTMFQNSSMQL